MDIADAVCNYYSASAEQKAEIEAQFPAISEKKHLFTTNPTVPGKKFFLVDQAFYMFSATGFFNLLQKSILDFTVESKADISGNLYDPDYATIMRLCIEVYRITGKLAPADYERDLLRELLVYIEPELYVTLVLHEAPNLDIQTFTSVTKYAPLKCRSLLVDTIFGNDFQKYQPILQSKFTDLTWVKSALREDGKSWRDYTFYANDDRFIINTITPSNFDKFDLQFALQKYGKQIPIEGARESLREWSSGPRFQEFIPVLVNYMTAKDKTGDLERQLLDADNDSSAYISAVGAALKEAGLKPLLFDECKLGDLPQIPEKTLLKSEIIFKNSPFDAHKEGLRVLRGKAIEDARGPEAAAEIIKRVDAMEKMFTKGSPLELDEAFVYRGFRVNKLEDIDLNFKSVTFAAPFMEKALQYAKYGSRTSFAHNDYAVLFIIRIKKGFPVIRTSYQDEIILPRNSEVIFDPSRESCSIVDANFKVSEEVKNEINAKVLNPAERNRILMTEGRYYEPVEEYFRRVEFYAERTGRIRVIFCNLVQSKRKRLVTMAKKISKPK